MLFHSLNSHGLVISSDIPHIASHTADYMCVSLCVCVQKCVIWGGLACGGELASLAYIIVNFQGHDLQTEGNMRYKFAFCLVCVENLALAS